MKTKYQISLDWNSLEPDMEVIDRWLYEEFPQVWNIEMIKKFNKNKIFSIINNKVLLTSPKTSRIIFYLGCEYFWTFVDKYKHYICLYRINENNKIVRIKHILSARKPIVN